MKKEPLDILFVEDDTGDVALLRKAFERHKLNAELNVVADGVAALDYLHKRGAHANAVRPGLILLDLNLPQKDGRQVLSEIKESHALKSIPVITLTASNNENDIAETYSLGSNTYLTKPDGIEGYDKVVKTIQSYV